jgi:hypothetical protein
MDAWGEAFRLGGTLVALGLIVTVVAVTLIFEAPRHWPDDPQGPKPSPGDRASI